MDGPGCVLVRWSDGQDRRPIPPGTQITRDQSTADVRRAFVIAGGGWLCEETPSQASPLLVAWSCAFFSRLDCIQLPLFKMLKVHFKAKCIIIPLEHQKPHHPKKIWMCFFLSVAGFFENNISVPQQFISIRSLFVARSFAAKIFDYSFLQSLPCPKSFPHCCRRWVWGRLVKKRGTEFADKQPWAFSSCYS